MTYTVCAALVLVLSSGDVAWLGAWLYLGLALWGQLMGAWTLALDDAGAMRARSDALVAADVASFDRVLGPLSTFAPLAILGMAGLALRWHWRPGLGSAAGVAGAVAFVLGSLLVLWAMSANPYYTSGVRTGPAHARRVVAAGPYRFVRHPGAVGSLCTDLAIPAVLGVPWAYPAAGLVAGFVVLRTVLEDRAMRAGLPRYRAYARRVRWGLLPALW